MQRDPKTSAVLGAAVEVHKNLGAGFLESVYLEALCAELRLRDIPHQREVAIPVFYKGEKLGCGYRVDLLCYGYILVELKAQVYLTAIDEAQVINYLRATELEVALLLNFGAPRLQIKRMILSAEHRLRGSEPTEVDFS